MYMNIFGSFIKLSILISYQEFSNKVALEISKRVIYKGVSNMYLIIWIMTYSYQFVNVNINIFGEISKTIWV